MTSEESGWWRRGALAAALWIACATAAFACEDFSKAPSSRWRVAHIDGRAWLLTPCGERFFSLGVNVMHPGAIDPSLARAPDSRDPVDPKTQHWIEDATGRVRQWGFNSAGAWSLTPELLKLPAKTLLHRLYHQEDIRLFDPRPVSFRCSCSNERVVAMLRMLGYAEVKSILEERDEVEVTCDFCNRAYRYDSVDAEQLFAATHTAQASTTRH